MGEGSLEQKRKETFDERAPYSKNSRKPSEKMCVCKGISCRDNKFRRPVRKCIRGRRLSEGITMYVGVNVWVMRKIWEVLGFLKWPNSLCKIDFDEQR